MFATRGVHDAPKLAVPPMFPADEDFDLNAFCSIDKIRHHTKTDDIARVTDEQLRDYRKAAFEAAELYSGLRLERLEMLTEELRIPMNFGHSTRHVLKHRLKFPVADDYVYVVGPGIRERVLVQKGNRVLRLPNLFHSNDFAQCCAPCGNSQHSNGLFRVMYRAGYTNIANVPAGILLGMLKFIAWNVENPGDVYQSVRYNTSRGSGAQDGTNNPAWASGALEVWRQYVESVT